MLTYGKEQHIIKTNINKKVMTNKNTIKLIVLDAERATVNEYTISRSIAKSPEYVDEFIEDQGHDLDMCQYLITEKIEYKIHQ